jgi:hypothetical protein
VDKGGRLIPDATATRGLNLVGVGNSGVTYTDVTCRNDVVVAYANDVQLC